MLKRTRIQREMTLPKRLRERRRLVSVWPDDFEKLRVGTVPQQILRDYSRKTPVTSGIKGAPVGLSETLPEAEVRHTHPLGQTLIVTSGAGLVQRWGGPVEEIQSGDVVCFEPGEKHWHGARPTVAITHIAIQEALNGKVVDWMEQVSDSQYGQQF